MNTDNWRHGELSEGMTITKELREQVLELRSQHGPNRGSGAELQDQAWHILNAIYKLEGRLVALERHRD